MSLWRAVRAGTRSLFRRRQVEQELDDELQHFLELATQENLRAGMPRAAAERAARLRVGGFEATKARVRSGGWEAGVETSWHDLRHALRGLRRNPGFSLLAIATVALGIGASTAMFSVINAVILRPLPYRNADRLALIWTDDVRRGLRNEATAYRTITDWRDQTRTFSDIAFFTRQRVAPMTNGPSGGRNSTRSQLVSGNLFALLDVAPLHGRVISPADEAQRAPVAVISYSYWQREFAGSSNIIGRTMVIDDGSKGGMASVTIIGVMPPEFYFPDKATSIWTVATTYWRFDRESTERFPDWARRWTAVGRLTPDATMASARAELARLGRQLSVTYPSTEPDFPGFGTTVLPVLDSIAGSSLQSTLWLLLGAVGVLLLVACTNVANLLLARGAARQQEFAVRRALGAGRGRLVRQLTVESVLLALCGGVLGMAVATWGTRLIATVAATLVPRLDEITLDVRVLVFATALSLVSGLVFGIVPALRLSAIGANEALREGGRGTAGVRLGKTRGLLVMVECALAIVLLAGAGLLIKSLQRVRSVDPGFEPHAVLNLRLEFPSEAPPTAAERTQTSPIAQTRARGRVQQMQEMIERVRGVPGVEAVGFIDDLFIAGEGNESITIPGRSADQMGAGQLLESAATPGFFDVLRVPLRQGRYLSDADAEQKVRALWSLVLTDMPLSEKAKRATPEPVVVNEAFVRRFFPDETPIGKRFCIDPTNKTYWYEIVGVVGDMHRQGLERSAIPQYIGSYFPVANGRADLIVRTKGDPLALAPTIRSVVTRQLPNVTVASIATAEAQLGDFSALRRLQTGLLATFAALALILAAVGIFGLVHYAVGERTREIGLRVALGASPRNVLRLVIMQGIRMPVIGIAIGLAAAAALTRVLAHLLFGVGALDPLTFVSVALVLTVMALLACYAAARRALGLDPLLALR
jgi:putative ABC transport system permease protein